MTGFDPFAAVTNVEPTSKALATFAQTDTPPDSIPVSGYSFGDAEPVTIPPHNLNILTEAESPTILVDGDGKEIIAVVRPENQ